MFHTFTDGNLRGATMRTAMGSFYLRPFSQPSIEGFFGGRFAKALEDAGEGALAAQSIDEIAALLGSDFPPPPHPARRIALGPRPPSRVAPIRTPCPATPANALCSPPRSTVGCSSLEKRPRRPHGG